jgi:hypothetical protein
MSGHEKKDRPEDDPRRNASRAPEPRARDESTKAKKKEDRELDEALEETFPASDPASVTSPTSLEPAGDPRTKP